MLRITIVPRIIHTHLVRILTRESREPSAESAVLGFRAVAGAILGVGAADVGEWDAGTACWAGRVGGGAAAAAAGKVLWRLVDGNRGRSEIEGGGKGEEGLEGK